jgi:hypothetical protein
MNPKKGFDRIVSGGYEVSMKSTLLYVPAEGYTLLAPSSHGATVPTTFVLRCPLHGIQPQVGGARDGYLCPACRAAQNDGPIVSTDGAKALILAADGLPVPESIDRAARTLAAFEKVSHPDTAPEWGECSAWAGWGFHLGAWHGPYGTVVYHGVPLQKRWGPRRRIEVPSLRDLGPTDPRMSVATLRLRRLHALALVLVARLGGEAVALDIPLPS